MLPIEKNIIRHRTIVEYLYYKSEVTVSDLARQLNSSSVTIRNDLRYLEEFSPKYISNVHLTNGIVSMTIRNKDALIAEIYQDSAVLRYLFAILLEDVDYLHLSRLTGISSSFSYKLYHQVKEYIVEKGLLKDQKKNRAAVLFLTDYVTIDFILDLVETELWDKAQSLVRQLLQRDVILDQDLQIVTACYLMLERSSTEELNIEPYEMNHCEVLPHYQNIYHVFESSDEEIVNLKSESFFITLLFYFHFNEQNLNQMLVNHRISWQTLIQDHPDVVELIYQVLSGYNHLLNNQIFQIAFQKLLVELWLGVPVRYVSSTYPNDEVQFIYQQALTALNDWNIEYGYLEKIDQEIVLGFAERLATIVHSTQTSHYVAIVARDAEDHLLYQNVLQELFNHNQLAIDPIFYYSLEEVPDTYFHFPYIILCEQRLGSSQMLRKHPNVIPISAETIREDVLHLINSLFYKTELER